MKKLLIVGAGGFIGGFIAREGLNRGYDVWVTVRNTTSLRHLDDPRIHILTLDYDDPAQMSEVLDKEMPGPTGWEYVIYNLGATKALDFPEFNRVNFQYLRSLGEVLKNIGCEPSLFLFMSSLSVLGPGDEVSYSPLDSTMLPQPNTRYGVSKLKAEQWLEFQSSLPWVIFRPTGVYGPHDKDYMMMIQAIDSHVDFGVGYKKQLLTFIYVEDLVAAMYDCLSAPLAARRHSKDRRRISCRKRKEIRHPYLIHIPCGDSNLYLYRSLSRFRLCQYRTQKPQCPVRNQDSREREQL